MPSKSKKILLKKIYDHTISNHATDCSNLSTIAYEFYKIKDTVNFFIVNNKAIELAQKTNNNYVLGDAHWNYATYYLPSEKYDKAYYHFNKAYKSFSKNNNIDEISKILLGMSKIKGFYRDYAGSEALVIKAIALFKKTKNFKFLNFAYTHLGLLQKDIKEYDKALYYYEKSNQYYEKSKNKKNQYSAMYNNIGNIYLKKGEYNKAIQAYNKDLSNNEINITQFATLTDNKAYCQLLMKDTLGIKEAFLKL